MNSDFIILHCRQFRDCILCDLWSFHEPLDFGGAMLSWKGKWWSKALFFCYWKPTINQEVSSEVLREMYCMLHHNGNKNNDKLKCRCSFIVPTFSFFSMAYSLCFLPWLCGTVVACFFKYSFFHGLPFDILCTSNSLWMTGWKNNGKDNLHNISKIIGRV